MTKRLFVFAFFLLLPTGAGAAPILDFEDITIPGGTDQLLTSYQDEGFTLTAIDSSNLGVGLFAHGSNSSFFMGSQGLAATAPAAAPDNRIVLTRDGGLAFSVLSIDLARNFPFDPAPAVTFVGTTSAGGTVSQTFIVTTAAGVRSFQTFTFAGFTDLVSLTWGQPPLANGLHQFDNISLDVPQSVPEPASGVLLLIGVTLAAARRRVNGDRTR